VRHFQKIFTIGVPWWLVAFGTTKQHSAKAFENLFLNYVLKAVISVIRATVLCTRDVRWVKFLSSEIVRWRRVRKWIGYGDGYNPINLTSPQCAMCFGSGGDGCGTISGGMVYETL